MADTDAVLRVLLYPDDVKADPATKRQLVQANAFRPDPTSEEEERNGWLTVCGWISVWESTLTMDEEAVALTTNERRRYVVELNVGQVRALTIPGIAGPLFDVFWDPRPECVAPDGFISCQSGDLGHCGMSGLSLRRTRASLPLGTPEGTVKQRQRILRKELLDIATTSRHRLV